MKILINFRHGLGDAVQMTTVLGHLRKYRPDWIIDVATLIGKHSAFHGLCNEVFIDGKDAVPSYRYDTNYFLDWHECPVSYPDSPSTKAERCLREVFGIAPDPELCHYSIQRGSEAIALASKYLERVCGTVPVPNDRYPVVLIHYEGNTSAEFKNIPTEVIGRVCDDVLEVGLTPVILDWDYRTPLAQPGPDGSCPRIHSADVRQDLWRNTGTGDAEVLAALIEQSSLMIGVDSGPLHVAGATTTPTLGVWTHHHPLHYFGHAENVTHLIPLNHADYIRGERPVGETYFTHNYRYETYRDLEDALRVAVRRQISPPGGEPGLIFTRKYWIREDNGEQDLVVVQDIAENDSYRINEISLVSSEPVIVDVGAHIGCFSKRFHQKHPTGRLISVECCPENIPALRKNVADFATVVQAAVTYEPDVALLNAVYDNCRSTGGSALINRSELERRVNANEFRADPNVTSDSGYWADFREIQTLTLEDLMRQHHFAFIDVLKLDCEGSEFSILGKTPSLDRIGLIVGEYHGKDNFERLVAARFRNWKLKILSGGDLGTFWLTNPCYAVNQSASHQQETNANREVYNGETTLGTRYDEAALPIEKDGHYFDRWTDSKGCFTTICNRRPSSVELQASITIEEFRACLSHAFHRIDLPELTKLLPYYESLFNVTSQWKCHRIVEIGVRAGYSALTLLLANPGSTLIGIDADEDERLVNTHGGRQGFWRHAQSILATFPFHLILADSHLLRRLPDADLIYIDGDHSFGGCLADLRLAEQSTHRILVDDYDNIPSVRQACDTFTSEHGCASVIRWNYRAIFMDQKSSQR